MHPLAGLANGRVTEKVHVVFREQGYGGDHSFLAITKHILEDDVNASDTVNE